MKTEVVMPLPAALLCLYACNNVAQDYLGSGSDFFHGSFVTNKSADDLAEFYQAEDLLKIIAGHQIFFKLFMDKVVVGESPVREKINPFPQEDGSGVEAFLGMDESKMIVSKLGMEVAFQIFHEEEQVDGQDEPRKSFRRYERFIDYFPILNEWGHKILLWDQTWTYGFRQLEDGKVEVYHHGHEFTGPWPIRVIVWLHQRYVLWACERLVNSEAFCSATEIECVDEYWAEKKEQMMDCMPLVALKPKERTYSKGLTMQIIRG
jgi:hypothetical protein